MRKEMNCYEEKEMQQLERGLKRDGFRKTADCMWAKIYEKDNEMVVLTREW
nr:MAG TPA: hypothetical protein [Caudoviricetes sp.]DAI79705.1 MAG TPA: hypothetical protein [Caudoviricetes sp.]